MIGREARWLFAVVLLAAAGAAQAQQCSPIVELEPPLLDETAAQRLARGETVRLPFALSARASSQVCSFLIGFESQGIGRLIAHVERRPFGERLLDLPQATVDRLLSGVAEFDSVRRFELDLVVSPGPGLQSGNFNLRLRIRIYSGTDPGTAVQTSSLDSGISIAVPAYAEIEVLSDQGRQTLQGVSGLIDLGQLVSGARGRASVRLTGNTSVWLSVERLDGELVHVERPEYRVPFRLWLDSSVVPAGSPTGLSMQPGDLRELRVEIGDIEQLVAGSYRAAIRISVQAE